MLTTLHNEPPRVLAIQPTTQGFGYVVCEGPQRLIEWGTKTVDRTQKNPDSIRKALALVDWHKPDTLVFENTTHASARRSKRVERLLYIVAKKVPAHGAAAGRYSRADVKRAFAKVNAETKHEISFSFFFFFPELKQQLPQKRKPWESESPQMSVFDAAALAITYYAAHIEGADTIIDF